MVKIHTIQWKHVYSFQRIKGGDEGGYKEMWPTEHIKNKQNNKERVYWQKRHYTSTVSGSFFW